MVVLEVIGLFACYGTWNTLVSGSIALSELWRKRWTTPRHLEVVAEYAVADDNDDHRLIFLDDGLQCVDLGRATVDDGVRPAGLRHRRRRLMTKRPSVWKICCAHANSKVGRLKDNEANRMVVGKIIRDFLKDAGCRDADISKNWMQSVEIYFMVSVEDIETKHLANAAVARRNRYELTQARPNVTLLEKICGPVVAYPRE
jgi:hypothetical protein